MRIGSHHLSSWRIMSTMWIILALVLTSCAGYQLIEDKDYAIVQKVKSGEYDLVKRDELAQLKHDAEIGKSVGRYQTFSRGYRTWRMDTATGQNCLLLTTDAEWKKLEIAAQACQN